MKSLHDTFDRLDRRLNDIRFLSGNTIKMIAMLTMFVDHFSKTALLWIEGGIWLPMVHNGIMSGDVMSGLHDFRVSVLYGIGKIAFPLFAFLLTEGFCHTKNRRKYFLSMAIFALISELPFDMLFFGHLTSREGTFPFYWPYQNVFFTLLLGLASMWCIERFRCRTDSRRDAVRAIALQGAGVAVFAAVAELICSDHGAPGVLMVAVLYVSRKNRICQALCFLLAYMLLRGDLGIYQVFAALVILLYNGRRGELRINKYVFYAFYPLHIVILCIAVWLLATYVIV